MNILILGATGFIGSVVATRLVADGHAVTGLGRNPARAHLKQPAIDWRRADLSRMLNPEDWENLLKDQHAVVNCAGALQDGLSDDLAATQAGAMLALYAAAKRSRPLIVQISARTAGEVLTLAELVGLHRQWLGLAPAGVFSLAPWLTRPVTWLADMAGLLGWRSPLRSTAMTVMSEGIRSAKRESGLGATSAAATLAANPSGVQDLWFARLYLLKPLIISGLSAFWLLSGLIPLLSMERASAHFLPFMPEAAATALTLATCIIDVALGAAVLVRPLARRALLGMLAVSLAYLAGGSLLEPALWLDPLGPLVKVLPSVLLTLTALATLDER